MIAKPVAADDGPEYGPLMLALPTDKQREFVRQLVTMPPCKGRLTAAAAAAGYAGTRGSLHVISSRLAANDRVRRAIEEFARQHLGALAGAAVASLSRLLERPNDRNHVKAAAEVLSRVMPVESRVSVSHEHHVAAADIEKVEARIRVLAAKFGLLPATPQVIEGKTVDGGVA